MIFSECLHLAHETFRHKSPKISSTSKDLHKIDSLQTSRIHDYQSNLGHTLYQKSVHLADKDKFQSLDKLDQHLHLSLFIARVLTAHSARSTEKAETAKNVNFKTKFKDEKLSVHFLVHFVNWIQ